MLNRHRVEALILFSRETDTYYVFSFDEVGQDIHLCGAWAVEKDELNEILRAIIDEHYNELEQERDLGGPITQRN